MDATPAKWNVFRVICVPGSPILWAHRAPTAVLGSIFALEYFSLQRLRNCFSWDLVQRSTHDNTNRKTKVGWLRCFTLPVSCFKQLHFFKKRDSNPFIHRDAVTFIEIKNKKHSYLPFGRLFVSDALEQKGIIGQNKNISYSITLT